MPHTTEPRALWIVKLGDTLPALRHTHGDFEDWMAQGLQHHQAQPHPIRVVDCFDFFCRNDLTPHTWDVTSDSLAAAVATRTAARKLVLLKSVDIPPMPWPIVAANGWVDPYFPTAVADATYDVVALNFRRWLDDRLGLNLPPAVGV